MRSIGFVARNGKVVGMGYVPHQIAPELLRELRHEDAERFVREELPRHDEEVWHFLKHGENPPTRPIEITTMGDTRPRYLP